MVNLEIVKTCPINMHCYMKKGDVNYKGWKCPFLLLDSDGNAKCLWDTRIKPYYEMERCKTEHEARKPKMWDDKRREWLAMKFNIYMKYCSDCKMVTKHDAGGCRNCQEDLHYLHYL